MLNATKKVLVVEDEEILQHLIGTKLEKKGFSAVFSNNVDGAIKHLQDDKDINIIWLDHYLLGKEDGLDFVIKVKANPDWQNIPIFLVSNSASDEKVKAYLQLGINKYFTKSNYTLDDIIDDIAKQLSSQQV